MKRIRTTSIGLVFIAAGLVAAAQTVPPPQWKTVPSEQPVRSPFPLSGKLPLSVEIRPAAAISEQDKELEANEESSIREHAGLRFMDFTPGGGWNYSQIACPAFPGHLFLRFTRGTGKGDVSAFTASIPRFGEGHIRIIPIQRRGYSLWSPAPINKQTIWAFNHILTEENPAGRPDWAAIAVCYAALAGTGSEGTLAPLGNPILYLEKNTATIIFGTDDPRAKSWSMLFDLHGVLKKATHSSQPGWDWRVVPAYQTDPATEQEQATQ
jgi:hypothetical protein